MIKHRTLGYILGIEAALCMALCVAQASFAGVFSAAMAFPFEQIGLGLRLLSLSGRWGNIIAILLYLAASLLPAALLLPLRKRRALCPEDGLLALLSAVLFAVLYLMINPGDIGALVGGTMGLPVGKALLGGAMYSILCGYIVLRTLRLFFHGDAPALARYMAVMLYMLCGIFVYLAFGASFHRLLGSMAALKAGNVGNEHLLGTSYVFLLLRFLVDVLPYVLDVCIAMAALRLLIAWREDRYSEETVATTERISRLCVTAMAATVVSGIIYNLLQLLFAKRLANVSISVEIPLFSIAFVLAVLLLTRFVAENKQLKDENDSFV